MELELLLLGSAKASEEMQEEEKEQGEILGSIVAQEGERGGERQRRANIFRNKDHRKRETKEGEREFSIKIMKRAVSVTLER